MVGKSRLVSKYYKIFSKFGRPIVAMDITGLIEVKGADGCPTNTFREIFGKIVAELRGCELGSVGDANQVGDGGYVKRFVETYFLLDVVLDERYEVSHVNLSAE